MCRPTGQKGGRLLFASTAGLSAGAERVTLAYRFSAYVPVGSVGPVARAVSHPRFLLRATRRPGDNPTRGLPRFLLAARFGCLNSKKGLHRTNDLEFAR